MDVERSFPSSGQSSEPPAAPTTIATRTVSYSDVDTSLTGVLVWNEAQPRPKPGILLIHGGAGLDQHARDQAHRYAELGYAVLACDMYGDGIAGDRARVMACLTALRDNPALLVRRGQAGLTALADCPEVSGNLAAIGFCFGGMAALALARSGADVGAVVSIHGSLTTNKPAERGTVTAKVLVCHGASDPHIPIADVVAFADEMSRADADWQLNIYGQAMHGFTHKHAAPGSVPGVAYDRTADERSFDATRTFLAATHEEG
ncbi:dienelactone hydrolase family protein [Dactylosporangium sp. NPDC049140]|uniref:dienelactone hydrolase family protein n=1 Tax=Dactylosporangium sp. NPDC049140 TaxID=3155647 RepID=UPI0033FC87A7